ncbi:MAG TPA: hypothetical protein VIG45_01455 [Erysipelothrix sp.]
MLQTGTLYTLINDKNSIVKKEPIENVYIYFSKDEKHVLTTKTDSAGKFSFNLPMGSYQVSVSQGAGFRVFDLAGGAPFELTEDSKQNAFEEWVLSPIYLKPESNPLVLLLQDMIQNIQIEATEAIVDIEKIKKDAVLSLNQKAGQVSKDATKAVNDINEVKTSAINNINSLKTSAIKDLNNIANQAKTSASNAKTSENAAKKTVDDFNKNTVGSGKLMREGAGGVLVADRVEFFDFNAGLEIYNSGFQHRYIAGTAKNRPTNTVGILESSFDNIMTYGYRKYTTGRGDIFINPLSKGFFNKNWFELYSTKNTTVDSNGFIKSASPIVRLFDDRIETNDQFKEEPIFEKIGVGTYKISNTLGLAKEGWTYEKPRGKDGNPYFRIIVKKTDDGCIISVHDEFEALEEATITDVDGNERKINKVVKILGEARDIKPHERWIDLRFHEDPEEIEEIEDLEKAQSNQDKFLEDNDAVLL